MIRPNFDNWVDDHISLILISLIVFIITPVILLGGYFYVKYRQNKMNQGTITTSNPSKDQARIPIDIDKIQRTEHGGSFSPLMRNSLLASKKQTSGQNRQQYTEVSRLSQSDLYRPASQQI